MHVNVCRQACVKTDMHAAIVVKVLTQHVRDVFESHLVPVLLSAGIKRKDAFLLYI